MCLSTALDKNHPQIHYDLSRRHLGQQLHCLQGWLLQQHTGGSTDRLDLFVPRVRTVFAQCRAFALSGPCSWNDLPSLLRANLMSGISVTSYRSLKTFSPPENPRWTRLWMANTARGALKSFFLQDKQMSKFWNEEYSKTKQNEKIK